MATYSIGEIEELTGIKAHVLRYWEEVIPGFAPKKDMGGRRVYFDRDIQTIMRLKYLIHLAILLDSRRYGASLSLPSGRYGLYRSGVRSLPFASEAQCLQRTETASRD